jgi:hypothetical protein
MTFTPPPGNFPQQGYPAPGALPAAYTPWITRVLATVIDYLPYRLCDRYFRTQSR